MGKQERDTLLNFFKALANESRLKIIGVLASQERGVGELAALLSLTEPTVSHHLSVLKDAGLVAMRREGTDHLYRLQTDRLQEMSEDVFDAERVEALADDIAANAWERKVLRTFLDGDRIAAMPAGYKKRLAVLKWLVNKFEMGVRYPEQELNEIIQRHHEDYCMLRREMIDAGLMEREFDVYWRIPWTMPSFG